MAGKYAEILPRLPHLPTQDQGYQDKVDLVKRSFINNPDFEMSPTNLAKRYANLRAKKEEIEQQLSDCNLAIEAFTQMLVETNEANNPEWGTYGTTKNTLRLITGDKIEVRKEPYATVEDKDANRKWAMENGLERLLALPWQTINSLTKEKLLAGEPEPDGIKVFVKTKLVFTAMKSND